MPTPAPVAEPKLVKAPGGGVVGWLKGLFGGSSAPAAKPTTPPAPGERSGDGRRRDGRTGDGSGGKRGGRNRRGGGGRGGRDRGPRPDSADASGAPLIRRPWRRRR